MNLIKIDLFPSISHRGWFSRTNMAVVGVEWELVDLGYTSSQQTSLIIRCLFTPIWSVHSFSCLHNLTGLLCFEFVCLFAHVHVCSLFSLLSRVIISLTECHYMRSVICWLFLSCGSMFVDPVQIFFAFRIFLTKFFYYRCNISLKVQYPSKISFN